MTEKKIPGWKPGGRLEIPPLSENLLAFVSFWEAGHHLSSKTGPLLDPVHTRAGLRVGRGGWGNDTRKTGRWRLNEADMRENFMGWMLSKPMYEFLKELKKMLLLKYENLRLVRFLDISRSLQLHSTRWELNRTPQKERFRFFAFFCLGTFLWV